MGYALVRVYKGIPRVLSRISLLFINTRVIPVSSRGPGEAP
jgi:hypothetical protein